MTFDTFALHPHLLATLTEIEFTKPTLIQAQTIPLTLDQKDILGIAQTGTGKTAAFLLPLLTLMAGSRARARMPRCIILGPTRELATQVHERCKIFGENLSIESALLIGGTSSKAQEKKIDEGVDILIATPGRFIDHFERGKLLLNDVRHLVVDEADRMLDMGFIPDIRKICSITPKQKQTLLFSATMPDDIEILAKEFMHNPEHIEIKPETTTNENVTHSLFHVDERKKRELLRAILSKTEHENVIVFCNSKRGAGQLNDSMIRHGFSSAVLHGDIPQNIRTNILDQFRAQKLKFLIATDVAARGIDINCISHVFNFDLPFHAEDYVHRIGRTGRGDKKGTAYSFYNFNDEKQQKCLKAIENFIQKEITPLDIKAFGIDAQTQRKHSESGSKQNDTQHSKRRSRKKEEVVKVQTLDHDPSSFKECKDIPAFLVR